MNPNSRAPTTMAKLKSSSPIPSSSSPSPPPSHHHCCHLCVPLLLSHLLLYSHLSPHPPSHYFIVRTPRKHQKLTTNHQASSLLVSFLLIGLLVSALLLVANVTPSLKRSLTPAEDSESGAAPVPTQTVSMVPLPLHEVPGNASAGEREFWQQPDRMGHRPCLGFSLEYRKASVRVVAERRRFLVVVASGGLNQQRNQIIDAVVIARILGAALVVPVLKANVIWGDDSSFADIFDIDHFKRTLRRDVHIVSSLPSSHQMARSSPIGGKIPFSSSPFWIRQKLLKPLNKDGVLVLKALDSKLSKSLPSDLQKLRCKVAFHALKFAAPILELGNELARRMWAQGPYVAIHLRMEKDVWVRTGCLPGLGWEHDDAIVRARKSHPELLTGRLVLSHHRRKLAGLCPLTAHEVARLLAALGAPSTTRLYLAGGEPYGGKEALKPLIFSFPNVVRKEALAAGGELEPYANRSSALAAVDFLISLSSDVFLPSHGGNMGRALQGYRAYAGHRKTVWPNKRGMVAAFRNSSMSEEELGEAFRRMHRDAAWWRMGGSGRRGRGRRGDVIAYPETECMCRPRPRRRVGVFYF